MRQVQSQVLARVRWELLGSQGSQGLEEALLVEPGVEMCLWDRCGCMEARWQVDSKGDVW